MAVRELLLGPKRFSQLLSALRGISTNLLTARTKSMVEGGLVHKRCREYELTEFGWELEPVIFSLAAWGSKTMLGGPREDEVVDLGWMLLSTTRSYKGHLIASKYERGSVILTSNLGFSKWTEVMGDQALAGAFVERRSR